MAGRALRVAGLALGLALGAGGAAPAQQAPPGAEAPAAVGRLDADGRAECTATLIAPDLVLTAGHCAEGFAPGGPWAPTRLTVQLGLADGRAAAVRGVRRVVLHPRFGEGEGAARLGRDLALLVLARAVDPEEAAPLAPGAPPRAGGEAMVAAYPRARAARPEVQACRVLGLEGPVAVTDCAAERGVSGAPVVVAGEDGPRVVAVLVAATRAGDRPVALGATLPGALAELRAALAGGG